MGIIQSFERRLQGAVGNTFARLFGGSVHPAEVITALQTEASSKLERQGGRVIAPNHFTVRLGPTDRQGLGEDEQRVARALSDTIREYLSEQGWETFGDVEVELAESPSLHTGQFRISGIKDPDAGRPNRQLDAPGAEPAYQGYPDHRQHDNQPGRPQPGHPQPEYAQPEYDDGYDNGYDSGYDYRDDRPRRETVASLHAEDGSGRRYRLQRGSNVVGRGQEAAFRLPDTSVSRRHIDIYFDGVVAVLHDLGSTNGTTVNGAGVQTWQLADGDVIRLGHSTISFTQEG